MKLAILFGAVTIALFFIINQVAERYGPDVGRRFLERGPDYTTASLRAWVASGENSLNARHYAMPVLFPLDLVFLLALGGFLACGSVVCAQSIALLRNVTWLFAALPGLYVAADLLEDALLARFLLNPENITDGAVSFAQTITAVKIKTAGLAIAQTALIAAASLVLK
jgi:hypothetical protein